jgi:hypothetical protein
MRGTWRRSILRIGPIAVAGLLAILVAAPSASGQSAVDQYVPNGNPTGGAGSSGTLASPYISHGPGQHGRGIVKAKIRDGSGSGGELPFTGYPLTPFVWIVLAVLVAAALLRVTAALMDRRRVRGTG